MSTASFHLLKATPVSYSSYCCSQQSFVWVLVSFIQCATQGSCFTSVPVSFHPRLLCWHRGRHPNNTLGIHACTTPKGRGANKLWGETWTHGGWEPMGKCFLFSFPGQNVLDHMSYSFSGFPRNPATNHHRRGLLHYPLSFLGLPLLPCFTPPGPHPCTLAPPRQ